MVLLLLPLRCQADDLEIVVDVAPNILNLQSNGQVITVHTSLAFNEVDINQDIFLNGIAIDYYKYDDRGLFVAKFVMDDMRALADDGFFDYL